jgi:hypothetical protein
MLPPGTQIEHCRIVPAVRFGDEPYLIAFEVAGQDYSCPLYSFQPRTQAAPGQPLESGHSLEVPTLKRASVR